MIVGRKLDVVSGTELIFHPREDVNSVKKFVPKGVRSDAKSVLREPITATVATSRPAAKAKPQPATQPVKSTTSSQARKPRALTPTPTPTPAVHAGIVKERKATTTPSNLPPERSASAAKWLREEKEKAALAQKESQFRRAKALQVEEQIQTKRQIEESERINRDLKLLMTSSFEDLFKDDMPNRIVPVPMDPPRHPMQDSISIPSIPKPDKIVRKARTDSGLGLARINSSTEKKSAPRGSSSKTKDEDTIPSIGVPITRRAKNSSNQDDYDDFEFDLPSAGRNDDRGEDNYADDGFENADTSAAGAANGGGGRDNAGDNNARTKAEGHKSAQAILEEKLKQEKEKRRLEGKMYKLKKNKELKEALNTEKYQKEKTATERVSKLSKIRDESRLLATAKLPESARMKLERERRAVTQENIPVFEDDDWAVVGDEFNDPPKIVVPNIDAENVSNLSNISKASQRSNLMNLSQLLRRVKSEEPVTAPSSSKLVNTAAAASINAFYDDNRSSSKRVGHLDFVPPTFPTFSADMGEQIVVSSPASSKSNGSSIHRTGSKSVDFDGKSSAQRSKASSASSLTNSTSRINNNHNSNNNNNNNNKNFRSVSTPRLRATDPETLVSKRGIISTSKEPVLPVANRRRSQSAGRLDQSRGSGGAHADAKEKKPFVFRSMGSSGTGNRSRSTSPSTTRLAIRRQSASQASEAKQVPSAASSVASSKPASRASNVEDVHKVVEKGSKHLNTLIVDLENTLRSSLTSLTEKLHKSFEFALPAVEQAGSIRKTDSNGNHISVEVSSEAPRSVPAASSVRFHRYSQPEDEGSDEDIPNRLPTKTNYYRSDNVESDWVYVNAEADAEATAANPLNAILNSRLNESSGSESRSHPIDDDDMVCQDDSSVASDVYRAQSPTTAAIGAGDRENEIDREEEEGFRHRKPPVSHPDIFDIPLQSSSNVGAIDPVTFHRLEFAKEKQKIMEMYGAMELTNDEDTAMAMATTSADRMADKQNANQPASEFSLRNVGVLGGMLNADYSNSSTSPSLASKLNLSKPAPRPVSELGGSRYDKLRQQYESESDSQSDDDEEDDEQLPSDRDHRIISVVAKEILRKQMEQKQLEEDALIQAEMKHRIEEAKLAAEKRKMDALQRSNDALDRMETDRLLMSTNELDQPVSRNTSNNSEEVLNASQSYFDSLLVQPLPTNKANASKASSSIGNSGNKEAAVNVSTSLGDDDFINEPFHKIVPRVVFDPQQSSASQNKPSAADMRLKMMEELHRQDDLFKYAFELSELEQQRTVQSASEVVQMLVSNADREALELRRQQELAAQQQAYEMSLTNVAVHSQLALNQQKLAQEKELLELQAQLKIESMHSYFLSLRQEATQAADSLEQSAQLMQAERLIKDQQLQLALVNVNTQEEIINHQSLLLQRQSQEHQQKVDQLLQVVQQSAKVGESLSPHRRSAKDRTTIATQVNTSLQADSPKRGGASAVPKKASSSNRSIDYEDEDYEDYSNVFDQESQSFVKFDRGNKAVAAAAVTKRLAESDSIIEDVYEDDEDGQEVEDEIEEEPEEQQSAIQSVASVQSSSLRSPPRRGQAAKSANNMHKRDTSVSEIYENSFEPSFEEIQEEVEEEDEEGDGSIPDEDYYSSVGGNASAGRPPLSKGQSKAAPAAQKGQQKIQKKVEQQSVAKKTKSKPFAASARSAVTNDYSMDDFEMDEDEEDEEVESEEAPSEVEEEAEEVEESFNRSSVSRIEEDIYSQTFDESMVSQKSFKSKIKTHKQMKEATAKRTSHLKTFDNFDAENFDFSNAIVSGDADQMIEAYKAEMDSRLQSQQKSLNLRRQILEAKKKHQLESVQAKYAAASQPLRGNLKQQFAAEVELIENLHAEAYADIEREKWEMSAKYYKELRKFNKLKIDLVAYKSSITDEVFPTQSIAKGKPVTTAAAAAAAAASQTANANKQSALTAKPVSRAVPISSSLQSESSDNYESSFESAQDISQDQSLIAAEVPSTTSSPKRKGIAFGMPQQKTTTKKPENDEDTSEIEEIEDEYDDEEGEIEEEANDESASQSRSHSKAHSRRNEHNSDDYDEQGDWEVDEEDDHGASREIEEEEQQEEYDEFDEYASASMLSRKASSPTKKKSAVDLSTASGRYDNDFEDETAYSEVFDVSQNNMSSARNLSVSAAKQSKSIDKKLALSASAKDLTAIGESTGAADALEAEGSGESGDTIEDLDKSIELRQQRIDDLKKKIDLQQLERERLEVIRKKAAEKKALIDMENELRRALELEAERIKNEKQTILNLEQKEEQEIKAISEPHFEDRVKMKEWKDNLKSAVEDEDVVLSEELEVEEDSWGSGKFAMPTSVQGAQLDKQLIADGMLYGKVSSEQAATKVQALLRGAHARKKAKQLQQERAWAREELERLRYEDSNLAVNEDYVEEQEQLAMDDSFASGDEYLHDRSLGLGFEVELGGSASKQTSTKVSPSGKKTKVLEEESFIMEESDDDEDVDDRTKELLIIKNQLAEAELLEKELQRLADAKAARDALQVQAKAAEKQESPSKEFTPLPTVAELQDGPFVAADCNTVDDSIASAASTAADNDADAANESMPKPIVDVKRQEDSIITQTNDQTVDYSEFADSDSSQIESPVKETAALIGNGNDSNSNASNSKVGSKQAAEDSVDEIEEEIEEAIEEDVEEFAADVEEVSIKAKDAKQHTSPSASPVTARSPAAVITAAAATGADFENDYGDDFDDDDSQFASGDKFDTSEQLETEVATIQPQQPTTDKNKSPLMKVDKFEAKDNDDEDQSVEEEIEELLDEADGYVDEFDASEAYPAATTAATTSASAPIVTEKDSPVDELERSAELSMFDESNNFSAPSPKTQPQQQQQQKQSLEGSIGAASSSNNVSLPSDSIYSPAGQDRDTSLVYSMGSLGDVDANADALSEDGTSSDVFKLSPTKPVEDLAPKTGKEEENDDYKRDNGDEDEEIADEIDEEIEEEAQADISNISSGSEDLVKSSSLPEDALHIEVPDLEVELAINAATIVAEADADVSVTNDNDASTLSVNPMNESDLDTVAWDKQQQMQQRQSEHGSGSGGSGSDSGGVAHVDYRAKTSAILTFTPERGGNQHSRDADDNDDVVLLDLPANDFKAKQLGRPTSSRSLLDEEDEDDNYEVDIDNVGKDDSVVEEIESSIDEEESSDYRALIVDNKDEGAVGSPLDEKLQISGFSPAQLSKYADTMTNLLLERLIGDPSIAQLLPELPNIAFGTADSAEPEPEPEVEAAVEAEGEAEPESVGRQHATEAKADDSDYDYDNDFDTPTADDEAEPAPALPSKQPLQSEDTKPERDLEAQPSVKASDDSFTNDYDDSFDETDSDVEYGQVVPIHVDEPASKPSSSTSLPSLLGNIPPIGGKKQPALSNASDSDSDEEDRRRVSSFDDELDNLYDFQPSKADNKLAKPASSSSPSPSSGPSSATTAASSQRKGESPTTNIVPVPYHADILICTQKMLSNDTMYDLVKAFASSNGPPQLPDSLVSEAKTAILQECRQPSDVVESNALITLDRINEIIEELYNARNVREDVSSSSNLSLPKRLLAQSFDLSPEGLRKAIMKQLNEDLNLVQEIQSGKKCMQEVVNVTILDGVQDQVTEKLKEVSSYVADTILNRMLMELTQSLATML